ncbi:hypothetical protein GCM10012275_48080 [Longimycelium tulufanense]|uniref:Uncharacterized protein n=1 Tax=Longimycelium tulufanense TaxID=907463 RepID=A0A8J3FX57_9PSEU|nr:hypothetical protein GCM10012275_48080 [Longimycelium tulufanense]
MRAVYVLGQLHKLCSLGLACSCDLQELINALWRWRALPGFPLRNGCMADIAQRCCHLPQPQSGALPYLA